MSSYSITMIPEPAKIGKLRRVLANADINFTNLGVGIANIGGVIAHNITEEELRKLLNTNKITGYKISKFL